MAILPRSTTFRHLERLFTAGTVAAWPDAHLLRLFVTKRDEDAFAALVARHGPMVLRVCRGILRDSGDAEDAFQATFLVLVRKAGSLWVDESLAPWLQRVAYRVALQANADAARRRLEEGRAAAISAVRDSEPDWVDQLRAELARLPEKYRRPIVLCALEGLTHAQGAAILRCGEATLRRRLARAREILRSRLTPCGVLPALGPPAHVPSAWVESTVRVASRMVFERFDACAAAVLARRASRTVLMMKLPVLPGALVALTAACLAIGIVACGTNGASGPPPKPTIDKESAKPALPTAARGSLRTQHGTIVGPDGKPVSGTRVYGIKGDGPDVQPLETSDFAFVHAKPGTVETLVFVNEAKQLAATLDVKGDEAEPLRVRLQPAGTITGRLVAEGQPRPGVKLRVLYLRRCRGSRKAATPNNGQIKTDPDGRFRVAGLVPGVEYKLEVIDKGGLHASNNFVFAPWWKIKSGQLDDWGEVTERPIGEDFERRSAPRQR
jgi:RNA polymerase sigma factor (sigma-70 family)